jgi:hypothetical protein
MRKELRTENNKHTKKKIPRKPSPHPTRHGDKTSNPHGETTKINPETAQSQTSGSTQATKTLRESRGIVYSAFRPWH